LALGINTQSGSGDFLRVVKYDARAGRMFRVDRDEVAKTDIPVDVTNTFSGLFDMENIEVGWMLFAKGVAPVFNLVRLGEDGGQKPGDQFKEGFRILLKLSKNCGGDVREFSSTAKVVLQGFDALHDAYLEGVKENPGKLPIVKITETKPVKSGDSTNYMPSFAITGWAERPTDFVFRSRARSSAPTATPPAASSTVPSTGAKPMAAPSTQPAQAPEPAMAGADDDFG